MHELSVALEICRIAEERLGPERAAQLDADGAYALRVVNTVGAILVGYLLLLNVFL